MSSITSNRMVIVTNPQGLHARPANLIADLASQFNSDIRINKSGECVDGKSILSLMTLAAEQGTQLYISATGQDAEAALDALSQLFEQGFGESKASLEK